MGIKSWFKGLFGISGDSSGGVQCYRIKVKPIDGNWKKLKDIPPKELERFNDPSEIEDMNTDASYKLVEILDKNGTQGETVWEVEAEGSDIDIESIVEDKLNTKLSGSGSRGQGTKLDALENSFSQVEQEADQLREIAKIADKISRMFGEGSDDSGNSLAQLEFEGKLPVWMHPQAREAVKAYVSEIADEVAETVADKFKNDDEGKRDDIDNKLNRAIGKNKEE